MWTTITVPAIPTARLLTAALAHLHHEDQSDGCCPRCCGSCWAIDQFKQTGMLDQLARTSPGTVGATWWADDQIDRAFLERAWRRTSCHGGASQAAEQDKPPVGYRTVEVVDGWALTAPADADEGTVLLVADELRESVEYLTGP